MRLFRGVPIAFLTIALLGCSQDWRAAPSGAESATSSLAPLVVSELKQFVRNESFVIPSALARRSVDREASSEDAVRIANAFGTRFFAWRMLDQMRGTKTSNRLRKLQVCEPPSVVSHKFVA
jgi:hypothetical protein